MRHLLIPRIPSCVPRVCDVSIVEKAYIGTSKQLAMNPVWGVGCIHRRDTLPRYTACHTRKVHTRSYAATQINYIHRLEYCHRKPEVSVTTRIAPIPTFCADCRVGTPGWGHFPSHTCDRPAGTAPAAAGIPGCPSRC
jgi:hypothetical protein